VHRGEPVSSDRLIEVMWGEQAPASAIKIVQGYVSNGLAAVAAAQGRDEIAARLRGAAHALGYPPATFDKRVDARLERDHLAAARTRRGDVAWRADEQAGAGLSREQAIAYALGKPSVSPPLPARLTSS
jgi:hypothetical protein